MSGRTQYGDLLGDAARGIFAASVAVERERFASRAAAEHAVTAWRDLLDALNRHGWALFGSDTRVTGLRASEDADPRDAAAVRLVDELADLGRRADAAAGPDGAAATAWRAAAVRVRTASDLLATHRRVDGAWRSPHGQVLDDPAVRAVGFAELAGFVVSVAEAATHLGLRAGQAGVPWRQVARLVPSTTTLVDAAVEVRRLGQPSGSGSPLMSLGVARPAVRTGDPVVELGDRLARLHRVAWQLTREPHVGVGTLADYAAAGVIVHEHAIRLLRSAPTGTGAGVHPLLGRLEQAGSAWRQAHLHTRQLRTATPALLRVRGDVAAIRHLLEHVAAAADADSHGNRPVQVILGGARAFTDVARWNAAVLDHLASTGQLHVPGRLLSGDEVSGHPTLVTAKLADRMASAPKERLEPLRAAYRAAEGSGPDTAPLRVRVTPTAKTSGRGPSAT